MYSNRRAHKEGVRGQLNRSRNDPATSMSRPELRFDHSRERLGYNNGAARNRFFLGGDLIYKF